MSLFFRPSASAGPSTAPPTTLDSVVLLPLTRRSYAFAQSSPDRLVGLLSSQPGAIVRTGDVISLALDWTAQDVGRQPQVSSDEAGGVCAWRVVMTEPVLSGIFVAPPTEDDDGEEALEPEGSSQSTQLMVAPWQLGSEAEGDAAESEPDDHLARSTSSLSQRSNSSSASSQRTVKPILSPPPTPPPEVEPDVADDDATDGDDDDEDDDDFEITSSFLQSALLSSSTAALPPGPSSESKISESTASLASSQGIGAFRAPQLGRSFQVGALSARLGSGPSDEDESTAWVRTRVLGEVGCFDGDWVRPSFPLPWSVEIADEKRLP